MQVLAHRRTFMKWVAAAPVFGAIAAREMSAKLAAAAGVAPSAEVYRRIGVRPFINARGTWTYLSGSLELPEVRKAMDDAARHFVDIFELERAAGRRLAELSGAESGIVTSGAAGAMAAATAACIAGNDPAKVWQLPDTTGLKDEVIMLGGRNAFDSAIRLAGGKLTIAMTHAELESKLSDRTAMVYTTWLGTDLEKAVAITRKAKVPLLLDDAAGIPPFENLKLYARMGLDLYCFSGGKGLRGPQCAGLLLGRKDLIEAALANYSPHEGAVCRPMKVGKEEIIGMLAAVEAWATIDLEKLNREWARRVERIAKLVETVPGVTTKISIPEGGNRYPTLRVDWDEVAFGMSVAQCDEELRRSDPRIEVLTAQNPSMVAGVELEERKAGQPHREQNRLEIVSMTLQEGEDLIVGQRLREVLDKARKSAKRN